MLELRRKDVPMKSSAVGRDDCTVGRMQSRGAAGSYGCLFCGGHDKSHKHGPKCGHEGVPHGDHTDYLVNGHLHHPHGDHCDDHGPVSVKP